MVDVILATALGGLGNLFRRGTLCADKQHTSTARGDITNGFQRRMEHRHGLLQVKDVDFVPLAENKRLHAGVPTAGVMSKMYTSFKHLAHGKGRESHFKKLLFSG